MRCLELIRKTGRQAQGPAIHKIHGECEVIEKDFVRYIISTIHTRSICNKPDLMGEEYLQTMSKGLKQAFILFPLEAKEVFEKADPSEINVVRFLRGGVAYDFPRVLWEVLGINGVHVTHYSLQRRFNKEENKWEITQDHYTKPTYIKSKGSVLVLGDIVASGVTVESGMHCIIRDMTDMAWDELPNEVKELLDRNLYKKANNKLEGIAGFKPLKNLFFFTIGNKQLERKMEKFHKVFKLLFPEYDKTFLIYLEGRFGLGTDELKEKWETPVISGTDLLVNQESLLSPEYEYSLWRKMSYLLEGCRIYDGGSRAYETNKHIMDVCEYWAELMILADKMSELEILKERFSFKDYELPREEFVKKKKEQWRGTSDMFINLIYDTAKQTMKSVQNINTTDAMKNLASKRLQRMAGYLRYEYINQYLEKHDAPENIKEIIRKHSNLN